MLEDKQNYEDVLVEIKKKVEDQYRAYLAGDQIELKDMEVCDAESCIFSLFSSFKFSMFKHLKPSNIIGLKYFKFSLSFISEVPVCWSSSFVLINQ